MIVSYREQKAARADLRRVFGAGNHGFAIHYSCESFYDRPEGASPRITSIAARKIDSGQTRSFSIHQVAERARVPPAEINGRYDELERRMLDEFFEFLGQHRESEWLHWNMRDINYGFQAIEHRYRVLGGAPYEVENVRKHDLARLLIAVYGANYTGHPRLESIVDRNSITRLAFMNGQEEADAFEQGNYVGLHQSTLRKVDIIANLAERADRRSLKTNAHWWTVHGGSIRAVLDWLATHPLLIVIASIASIAGLILAFTAL